MLIIENPIEPILRNTRAVEMTIFAHSVHRHLFVKKKLESILIGSTFATMLRDAVNEMLNA